MAPWKIVEGLLGEMKRCEQADAPMAAVIMAFVCIDTMAFLALPKGKTSVNPNDFIAWVDKYLKADPRQPYQYEGVDVQAARCAVLHSFGAETERHAKNNTIKIFGYNDGGQHYYDPSVDGQTVIISTQSFVSDTQAAVLQFLQDCQADPALKSRVQERLSGRLAFLPFPNVS